MGAAIGLRVSGAVFGEDRVRSAGCIAIYPRSRGDGWEVMGVLCL